MWNFTVYQRILRAPVKKALMITTLKRWTFSSFGHQLDVGLWLSWAIRGVSSSCWWCRPNLRERDMCPDVLSMCFAALMALFRERSRKFCLSADGECFRRPFDSFWLLNPVASFLLLGDAQSGDEHNLEDGLDAKKCDIGSDQDRKNYQGGLE